MYPELARIRDEIRALLDEAQNRPPDGAADGSIDETEWNQLKAIEGALRALVWR